MTSLCNVILTSRHVYKDRNVRGGGSRGGHDGSAPGGGVEDMAGGVEFSWGQINH